MLLNIVTSLSLSTLVDVGMLPFSWKLTKVKEKSVRKRVLLLSGTFFKEQQRWHFEKYQIILSADIM